MRFRPLGGSGLAVSALTLVLNDQPNRRAADWTALGYAALENGINSFEIAGLDPAIVDGLSVALKSVARRLVVVSLRLGPAPQGRRDFSARALSQAIAATVERSGLDYLDIAMLDDPKSNELPAESLHALKTERQEGRIGMLGVRGMDEAMDAYVLTEAFQVLATPYHMLSGWRERHRMRLAQERDMAVIGYDFYPDEVRTKGVEPMTASRPRSGWLRKPAPTPAAHAPANPYGFLNETPGWTAEEICLAYALTEPALSSVQVACTSPTHLASLAETPDKDIPAGLSSRVEMARFGSAPPPGGRQP